MSALPPGVVSGLPNITPTFSRIWLVNRHIVLDLPRMAASFRSAWLINRACIPMVAMPMSPSSSALGTSAATESITITSTAPERASVSQIVSASSPLSGWEISSSSRFTPSLAA